MSVSRSGSKSILIQPVLEGRLFAPDLNETDPSCGVVPSEVYLTLNPTPFPSQRGPYPITRTAGDRLHRQFGHSKPVTKDLEQPAGVTLLESNLTRIQPGWVKITIHILSCLFWIMIPSLDTESQIAPVPGDPVLEACLGSLT